MNGDDAGAVEDDAGVPPSPDAGCQDCCADGLPRAQPGGMPKRLAAFTPSPADVATCPDGRVFLTLDGPDQVWQIPETGPAVHFADVTGVQPAGIACDSQGRLFVIAFALRPRSPFSAPGILLLDEERKPRMLPAPPGSPLGTPNGIAAASGIGLYATDTLAGAVVVIREKSGDFETTVVADGMLGVNGVAYDGSARKLYVSNSLNQRVTSFVVAADGALSRPTVEWTDPGFAALDGMVVDELGRAYVAGYGRGEVLRIPEGQVIAKVGQPASLAFRGGTLLMVDYYLGEPMREGGLYALDVGVCGAQR